MYVYVVNDLLLSMAENVFEQTPSEPLEFPAL